MYSGSVVVLTDILGDSLARLPAIDRERMNDDHKAIVVDALRVLDEV